MNNRNFILFIVLSALLLLGYSAWQGRMAPKAPPAQVEETAVPVPSPAAQVPQPAAPVAQVPAQTPAEASARFALETAELRLTWRCVDGALLQVERLQDGTRFFQEANAQEKLLAFPGIGGALATRFEGSPELTPLGDGQLVSFRNAAGDRLSYRVPRRGSVVEVDWQTARGAHLALFRKPSDPKEVLRMGRFFAVEEKKIHAVSMVQLLEHPWYKPGKFTELPPAATRLGLDAGIEKGHQSSHYFAAIWELNTLPERDTATFPGYHARPDAAGRVQARLYLGPKQSEALAAFAKPCTQVLDWGFFGLIAKGLFWLLRLLQSVIPNWGWTLVLFSVLLRLALWPMNNKTTLQMLRMKDLEPYQKQLQAKYEKFGNDMAKKAEMQKELMAFYKKNGHNPMGGCLVMLLQMPVFLAIWSMLNAVFELRGAHWVFWIKDLSAKDPFYVLPILLGASMLAQQAMTPATGDPAQRRMMLILMPAMMTFFFIQAPVGLSLYYLVFNLIGMLQTWWVMRNYVPQPVKV